MDAHDRGDQRVLVVDIRKQAVLAVTDELRRLANPCRDQRDAGSQRLEHGLRPSLLPRRDE